MTLLLQGIFLLKEKEVKIDARNDNFESDTSTFIESTFHASDTNNFGQDPPSLDEWLFTVSTMSNDKAPGPSMLSYELLFF
ncbi:hypothetical protein RirG_152150 [Rhizophagus irregularis DAOM 197198w]|uniref:Uncharacterized protein n=1 Tax=Rhizophagus irregularis (strain DAOM 197198w) TaxID=1432141 RepID=A0A015J1Q9_RHIIW|nr:hypothetical protein RirG_152150 [Rhizophagus irregularis DAOM 197198w]